MKCKSFNSKWNVSGHFVNECAGNPDFEDFDPSEPISRVDTLLYEHMAGDKQLAKVSVECG